MVEISSTISQCGKQINKSRILPNPNIIYWDFMNHAGMFRFIYLFRKIVGMWSIPWAIKAQSLPQLE